jgi:spore cortex biosynthesis protein YabQ
MSSQISEEVMLMIMSAYGGLVLMFCYDLIRVFRRIFKRGIIAVIIQDVVFWTIASIFMFNIYLKYNYGRPRFFSIVFTVLTMILFEWLIGGRYLDKLSNIIRQAIIGIKKIINKLLKPLKKLNKVIKLKSGISKRTKKGKVLDNSLCQRNKDISKNKFHILKLRGKKWQVKRKDKEQLPEE